MSSFNSELQNQLLTRKIPYIVCAALCAIAATYFKQITPNMSQAKLVKTTAAGIDPKQHLINVVMTDKSTFQIMTTWGKEGDTLTLDADPKNHSAWQADGKNFVNANNERLTKFKSKFGAFDFVGGKTDAPTEAA